MPLQSANVPEILTVPSPVQGFEWGGVNQSASRQLINDDELWWCENMFPVAPGRLRAGYGPSAPVYTAPSGITILRIFFANIDGIHPQGYMFLSNGTVDRVNLTAPHTVLSLGQIWGPATPPYYAALKVWSITQVGQTTGQIGILFIGSPQGLYAVDANGTVYAPGSTAPPQVTGPIPPNVTPQTFTMPTGLPGIYDLEVYKSRLWVMGQTVIAYSAPINAADFSTAGGGGEFGYFGDQLTVSYTDLATSADFLYLFGDSMINAVSNVQLTGQGTVTSPFTTTFLNTNIDPQNGQAYFRPVGIWSHMFSQWNNAGLQILSGQGVIKISEKLNNLMATLDSTPFQPTMCPVDFFGKRWLLFNGTFTDPFQQKRQLLLVWDTQRWSIATQRYNITNIGAYEQNSNIQAYGTDGTVLVQLFTNPDNLLEKKFSTKSYTGPNLLTVKQWKRLYMEMADNTPSQHELQVTQFHTEGPTVYGTIGTMSGGIPNGQEDIAFTVPPGGRDCIPQPIFGAGIYAFVDLVSFHPDFTIERLSLTYDERSLYGA